MDYPNISIEQWLTNEDDHLLRLQEGFAWQKVPLINVNEVHHFGDGTLVRFRGMVQDMYGPEIYMESFDVVNDTTKERSRRIGKYRDGVSTQEGQTIDLESDTIKTNERHCYVVISVPGLNAWVYQNDKELYALGPETSRSVEPSKSEKRSIDETMEVEPSSTETKSKLAKTVCFTEKSTKEKNTVLVSFEHLLNHPLGDDNAKVCQVKVYNNSEAIKLNDEIEFLGFLSLNSLFPSGDNEDLENEMEMQTHHPPSSLVPTIHVVNFKPLLHLNPLVDSPICKTDGSFLNIKRELQVLLTQLLLGDSLSADYLICNLISEVYLRKDFMVLGKLGLNISNVPILNEVDYVEEFYTVLKLLVPKSHYLPLTLDNMNTLTFTPKKDYECNRVTSGILQLSKNTHLVLDETKLQEGKLNTAGIYNVRALSNAIRFQKVEYDFNYYTIEYDCDIPFLIFSEGTSMLPSDMHIPLQADSMCLQTFKEILEASKHFLKPEMLSDIRKYLTKARLVKYEMSDEVQDLVQKEFVTMRQNDSGITGDDLHHFLVLTRLLCLSEGKECFDETCWRRACEMEKERKNRLKK